MDVPAYGERTGQAFLSFLLFLAVLAAAMAFVVLPGSRHVVEYVGDCSPPLGSTCVPPHRTVLVGDGYAGIRAAFAGSLLVLFLSARLLIRRAKGKRVRAVNP